MIINLKRPGKIGEEFEDLGPLLPGKQERRVLYWCDMAKQLLHFYWWEGLPGDPGELIYHLGLSFLNEEHVESLLWQANKELRCLLIELEEEPGFVNQY